jgi:hypothetical protein
MAPLWVHLHAAPAAAFQQSDSARMQPNRVEHRIGMHRAWQMTDPEGMSQFTRQWLIGWTLTTTAVRNGGSTAIDQVGLPDAMCRNLGLCTRLISRRCSESHARAIRC